MKRIITGTITLLSVATLVACSQSNKETTASTSKAQTTQSETTTEVKVDNSQYDSVVAEIKSALDPKQVKHQAQSQNPTATNHVHVVAF